MMVVSGKTLSQYNAGLALLVGLVLFSVILADLFVPQNLAPRAASLGFSEKRAMDHVRRLATKPRPVGSVAHAVSRSYLLSELRSLGLEVEEQVAVAANEFLGQIQAARVHNVVARIRGSEDGSVLLLVAHYDSVRNSPGANDNAAAVAALLESARVLRSKKYQRDVIFLFTDSEETGHLGMTAFLKEHRWADSVGVAFNFEARGNRGPVTMYELNGHAGQLVSTLAHSGARPVAHSAIAELAKILPNSTDFTVIKNNGVGGMNFAYAIGVDHYHTPGDDIESLQPQSLMHHGSLAVSLVDTIANRPVIPLYRFSPDLDARLVRLMSGDQSVPKHWNITFCGGSNVTLTIRTLAARPLVLRVSDEALGLPVLDGDSPSSVDCQYSHSSHAVTSFRI